MVLKVRKKGLLILPKKMRELAGLKEGDEVIAEIVGDAIVLRPLRPKIVDVDLRLVEDLLSEEYKLEAEKYEEIFKVEEDGASTGLHLSHTKLISLVITKGKLIFP